MWGPQVSLEQGVLTGNLGLEEKEINPFSSSSLWVFPSPALDKADSRLLLLLSLPRIGPTVWTSSRKGLMSLFLHC